MRAGLGGSHGATKPSGRFSWLRLHTLCAVPALSRWRVFGAFLDSFAREDTALRPHCGRNETGDGLILRQRRGIGRFRRLRGQTSIPASSSPATGRPRQGSPLGGIWHWRLDVRMPRMPSGLVTCQLPEQAKLTPGRYRREETKQMARGYERYK